MCTFCLDLVLVINCGQITSQGKEMLAKTCSLWTFGLELCLRLFWPLGHWVIFALQAFYDTTVLTKFLGHIFCPLHKKCIHPCYGWNRSRFKLCCLRLQLPSYFPIRSFWSNFRPVYIWIILIWKPPLSAIQIHSEARSSCHISSSSFFQNFNFGRELAFIRP